MKVIAIELNHVIRNINKQLLKYYSRDINQELDIDDIDEKTENVIDKYIKFQSKQEFGRFIYEDYPYELFGCANAMEKNLPTKITYWMSEMTNIEEEDIAVILFSLGEDALTIQSSYFFLSKIGTRVRKVLFPLTEQEVFNEADVIVTSNVELLSNAPSEKTKVLICTNGTKEEDSKEGFKVYKSLIDLIDDKNFLTELVKNND